jgi:acetyl esterase/lipase
VLKYRLAPQYGYPAPILDASRAIRTVRARATEWGIDPQRIGVIGFSAGGHVASTVATHFDGGDPTASDPIERVSSRPDLAILCYAVISLEDGVTHGGSKRNLLGPSPSPELVKSLSNENQVKADTPPCFLFHTADDGPVPAENALRFASSLARAKVPYELHVFATGPHGVGLAQKDPVLSGWPTLLAHWLRARGFIAPIAAAR